MVRHFLCLRDFEKNEILFLLEKAAEIKAEPQKYANALKQKTLLMIFAKPSLRTRVSFEVGMTQLGGHAIYYNIATSPLGKKETIADTAKTASRYVDLIMARLYEHSQLEELALNASVPVINALTNFNHPCQILADLLTIKEKKQKLQGLTLAYFGDANNNVTHSLLYGCSKLGINIKIACPAEKEFMPMEKVVKEAEEFAKESNAEVVITHDAEEAARGVDVIYTDSWMSYHIAEEEKEKRISILKPYQVTKKLMELSNNAIFMHCLPAERGMEVTAEVIDSAQSVVFDEAENRLHTQKALMVWLLEQES